MTDPVLLVIGDCRRDLRQVFVALAAMAFKRGAKASEMATVVCMLYSIEMRADEVHHAGVMRASTMFRRTAWRLRSACQHAFLVLAGFSRKSREGRFASDLCYERTALSQ